MVKIAPSILSADFSKLREQIKTVDDAGADWIHLDIMDGHFVPNITFGPLIVSGVRKITKKFLDAHLMISAADNYIEAFVKAGVDQLTVHVEACPHLWATISKIQYHNIAAGVTLNPATPVAMLEPVLHRVQNVLVMTVEPGFGGQKFIPETLEKIKELDRIKKERNFSYEIQVDGGIDEKTAPLVVKAGATCLVSGSSIFGADNITEAFEKLRNAAVL